MKKLTLTLSLLAVLSAPTVFANDVNTDTSASTTTANTTDTTTGNSSTQTDPYLISGQSQNTKPSTKTPIFGRVLLKYVSTDGTVLGENKTDEVEIGYIETTYGPGIDKSVYMSDIGYDVTEFKLETIEFNGITYALKSHGELTGSYQTSHLDSKYTPVVEFVYEMVLPVAEPAPAQPEPQPQVQPTNAVVKPTNQTNQIETPKTSTTLGVAGFMISLFSLFGIAKKRKS